MNKYMDAILYLKLIDDLYAHIQHEIFPIFYLWSLHVGGASADLVTLEEEYPAWVVFSHLLTPIPCFITRNLILRS